MLASATQLRRLRARNGSDPPSTPSPSAADEIEKLDRLKKAVRSLKIQTIRLTLFLTKSALT
jgi:hypothetical protein